MKKRTRWCHFWSIRESKNTIYWQFKNRDTTSACRRFTIRLISIFICCTKTLKMWKSAFTSTIDCTWIIDSWVLFSTMCASFASKSSMTNESTYITFITFRSIFTRRAVHSRRSRSSKVVWMTMKSTYY